MATFPSLTPSSRSFTPGRHPHSEIPALNGLQTRVRTSNVILEQQLRLTFVALTEAQMLSVRSHYIGQQGRFLSFEIPPSLLSGAIAPADFTPTGYSWIYATPPQVEDIGQQRYTVSVDLVTVPPEGANLNGNELNVYTSLAAGIASSSINSTGATLTVNSTLVSGIVADNTSAGLSLTVADSFTAGAATGLAGTGDPNFANVGVLLHMNGPNGSFQFFDSSANNFLVSNASNLCSITTAESKFGGASGSFSTGSLSAPGNTVNAALAMGTGDFTAECWVRVASHNATLRKIFQMNDGAERAGIFLGTGNTFTVRMAGTQITGTTVPAVDTWHHVALTRNASVHRLWVNGVQEGGTWTSGYTQSDARVDVGQNGFTGFVDDLRITKGVARYTATFTPSTTQFYDEVDAPAAATNPTFANVSLLLHMNGSNGSTTFTDNSTNAFTVTTSGNAQISTAQSKFGGASGLFDGAGDYLDLAANTAFDFGTDNWTIEFWYRSTATPAGFARIIAPRTSTNPASGGLQIWHAANTGSGAVTDAIELAASGGTSVIASTKTAVSDSGWHHIAFSRQSSVTRAYFDGVCKDVKTDTESYTRGGTEGIRIAGRADLAANTFVNGYIDDLRITKGVAIYTKPSYTVPAAAFPDS